MAVALCSESEDGGFIAAEYRNRSGIGRNLTIQVLEYLDRAGVTGEDGPSHHGVWDLALLQGVPGIRVAAPRDGSRLRSALQEAVSIDDGPTVVRFPKGICPYPEGLHSIPRDPSSAAAASYRGPPVT